MSLRTEKVASVIKRILAQPISDFAKESSAGIVTITDVRLSNDLQIAKVYISVYAGKVTPAQFVTMLDKKIGEFRSYVGAKVKLRFTPELRFYIDDSLDQIEHIQKLLDSVKKDASQ
jgi:ribosome-binding factor A